MKIATDLSKKEFRSMAAARTLRQPGPASRTLISFLPSLHSATRRISLVQAEIIFKAIVFSSVKQKSVAEGSPVFPLPFSLFKGIFFFFFFGFKAFVTAQAFL